MNISRYATLPKLLATGVLTAAIPLGAQALVLTGASSAYGESVVITVGATPVLSGPVPTIGGTAPSPYAPPSAQNPGVNVAGGALTTGLMTVNAQSNVDGGVGSRFALADSKVNDFVLHVQNSTLGTTSASLPTLSCRQRTFPAISVP